MAQQTDPNMKRIVPVAIIIGAIIILAISWTSITVTIDAGHGGVLFQRFSGGVDEEKVYSPGLHFMAPWNTMHVYETRKQEITESMNGLSSDGLEVIMEISLWYRPGYESLGLLHNNVGPDYLSKIVMPGLRSATRTVIGRYKPDQLYSKNRDEIQNEIKEETEKLLEDKYIEVENTLIRSIKLPAKIKNAIETKLEQEQKLQAYKFRLQTASKEAERQKIEAEGKARANRIISQSLTDKILKEKGIEATLKLSESNNAKTIVIGSGDGGLPIILGGNN